MSGTSADPFKPLLVAVVVTLIIERTLTAIYVTSLWKSIRKVVRFDDLRLYTTMGTCVAFSILTGFDIFAMMYASESTLIGKTITGLFCSGGSKAWADVYQSFMTIQESKAKKAQKEVG